MRCLCKPDRATTTQRSSFFIAGTHPTIRVKPAVPLVYTSRGWDFGWLMVRTDGSVVYRRCDPYTLAFEDVTGNYAMRWFCALIGVPQIVNFTLNRVQVSGKYSRKAYWRIMVYYGIIFLYFMALKETEDEPNLRS